MAGRVPSAQRRAMLISAGITIAQREGGRAVTLARVAAAWGVSKPIAYRLFSSLPELLKCMEQQVVAQYERAIMHALLDHKARGASQKEILEVLAHTYISYSLEDGAVYDTIAAALTALKGSEDAVTEVSPQLLAVIKDSFDLDGQTALPFLLMFQGAADNLVIFVSRGAFTRSAAIAHLVSLFTPRLGMNTSNDPVCAVGTEFS